jgi:TolB-like protein
MQFFSDGVSEEIIQRLSQGANLKVIARTSSFQLRGNQKAEAAQKLNCSHVLDGAIRRAAGRVRINAHLVETSSQTTLWSDRFDGELEDVFSVQDEISEQIAAALNQAFSGSSPRSIDSEVYDLYLRASPQSFAPSELREYVESLEIVTRREPQFAEAWGRLAYVRSWLHFYQPFGDERRSSAGLVNQEASRTLAADPNNVDAMVGQLFVIPPFGHFIEAIAVLNRLRQTPGVGGQRHYVSWFIRNLGWVSKGLEEAEQAYRLDPLDPMSANLVALARLAAGRATEAIPVYEALVEQVPNMTFPVSSLLRAYAFEQDWKGVDRLLAVAEQRELREFEDGLAFIRTKRDPTPEKIGAWRESLENQVHTTGCVDLSRLVFTAHLGLVDEAYKASENACLGPSGNSEDIMGPDGYRTSLMFMYYLPELRNDPRFPRLCARLGLVEFWLATEKWPDCATGVPYDFKLECEKVKDVPKDAFGPGAG